MPIVNDERELFPHDPALTGSEVGARFRAVEFRSPDERLSHRLLVRDDMSAARFDAAPRAWFRPISRVCGRESVGAASITVSVSLVEQPVGAADWMRGALDALGDFVIGRRDFFGPFGRRCDLLARGVRGGSTWLVRHVAVGDAARVFWLEAGAPEAAYAPLARDLLVSLWSFRPICAAGPWPAVAERELAMEGPAPVRFALPAGWTVADERQTENDRSVVLARRSNGSCAGLISVAASHAGSVGARALVARRLMELHQRGVRTSGAALLAAPRGAFDEAYVGPLKGTFDGQAVEAPTLIRRSGDTWIVLGLLAPAYETSPQWWAINRRAFEIVRDSLRVGETPESAASPPADKSVGRSGADASYDGAQPTAR